MASFVRFTLTVFVLGIFGCGSGGGGGGDSTPPATTETVSAIELLADAPVVGTNEATGISVRLYNASGQLFSGQKTVTFSVDNPALGSIEPSVSTATGVATATFNSRSVEGSVTLTASVDDVSKDLTIQVSDLASAASISLSASPSTLTVGGTSVFKARVLDSVGNPMPDGTLVTFSVNNSSLGEIVPNATVSGGNGEAQATFSASSTNVGTVTVTAMCGNASQAIVMNIAASPSGSIEFSSAEPQIIVIKGSGGVETSLINFLVKDVNGQPVLGSQSVQLKLSGPNGGEYIGSVPGTTILDVGTVDGIASAYLHSGTVPGTVTILATVVGTNLSTSSGVIAIGGGVPSAAHFSLSETKFNLEGLAYDGITSEINVRLADRYGNYNVLNGTAVSFYSECGAIDRSVNLNDEGEGSVTFRTQRPAPQNLPITPDMRDWYLDELGIQLGNNNNPLNGLCSIIAVVDGEEKFIDANGNGLYDFGESFDDTYDDVHLDKDDDPLDIPYGSVIENFPHDRLFEPLIVDVNDDGIFDGMNNQWDESKKIFGRIDLLYTGRPIISVGDGSGNAYVSGDQIIVPEASTKRIYFSVHDQYFNPPIPGTSFSVSENLGTVDLQGNKSYDFPDTVVPGAPVFYVDLVNSPNPDGVISLPATGSLTISVDWKGEEISFSLFVEGPNP